MSGLKEIPASDSHSDPSEKAQIHHLKKKQLTKADSPSPDPGIIRDMPAESMDGDIYIAADVNIVFFTEEALQMLHRGQKVIILPNPDKSVYDEALRKLRERFPGINQASREIIDLVREDWGR